MLKRLYELIKMHFEYIKKSKKLDQIIKDNPDEKNIWRHLDTWDENGKHSSFNEMISYNEYKQLKEKRK